MIRTHGAHLTTPAVPRPESRFPLEKDVVTLVRNVAGDLAHQPLVANRLGDSGVLEGVVCRLKEIERHTGIERTLTIGQLILTQFFGGNPAIWRDRRRNKNNSIRRLAEREDCPFSKSALNEAVAIYVASNELPCVRTYEHITASHVSVVLSLPPEERKGMLQSAESCGWSVKQLKNEVVAQRRADGERRGRPPRVGHEKALRALHSCAQQLRQALTSIQLTPLAPAMRRELEDLTSELLSLGADLRVALDPRASSMSLRSGSTTWPVEGSSAVKVG